MMSRLVRQLTPAQRGAVLRIAAQGGQARIRSDVLHKLRLHKLIESSNLTARSVRLTDLGRVAADELRADLAQPAERPATGPVDVVGVMLRMPASTVPAGLVGGVARLLLELSTDAERVAALAWLAAPPGAAYLGAIKDALIVACRPGRTYAQTAAHLGISTRMVNRAVSRTHGRQPELDTSSLRPDDLTGKAATPEPPTEG